MGTAIDISHLRSIKDRFSFEGKKGFVTGAAGGIGGIGVTGLRTTGAGVPGVCITSFRAAGVTVIGVHVHQPRRR